MIDESLYLLIGKYMCLYNILEKKVKSKFIAYFSKYEEKGKNQSYLSSIKTLIYLSSKSDKYFFDKLSISQESISILDISKSKPEAIKLMQILKLHEYNGFYDAKFKLLDFNMFKEKTNQVNVRSALLKLSNLRNRLAHGISDQFLEKLAEFDIDSSLVKEYVASDNVLGCNIFWMENILIPFLEKEDGKRKKYEIDQFLVQIE